MQKQTIKSEIANNIIVSMSVYLEKQVLVILDQVIQNELISLNYSWYNNINCLTPHSYCIFIEYCFSLI